MQSTEDEHTLQVAVHAIDPTPLTNPRPEGGSAGPAANANPGRRPKHASSDAEPSDFGWRDLLVWCGVPIVIVILIRILFVGFYSIPSGSMLDTIEPGDKVITSKLTPRLFDLQRGDIVVFKDSGEWLTPEERGRFGGDYLIKRLIGLPGDVVECEGAGQPVKVNGVAIDERAYLRPGVDPSSFAFRVEVTAGHVFVMGDNRSNSSDSRYHQDDGSHGLVPVGGIVGVAIARYWPLSRISGLSGHHDVFDAVPDGSAASD
ncbi:MAG: signal peptidase I [Bifidobacterium scardovii]|uniref:signal peptidase I n=1 Tax=Bifidobacterium scardovii TaxID=158787 RepID=UPI002901DB15|nr:signal peptidase I [Bifidobacterium scardovii]MDU2420504.1 signal peptidase I [Bifidobacterium scardovii]